MKTVLITGTSRGIGYVAAQKFLEEGWFVIGSSRSGKTDIQNKNFACFTLDLSKPESIVEFVKKVQEAGKKIDVLVNNAAAAPEEIGDPLCIDLLRETFEVNIFGTANLTLQLLPLLNSPSHIINISSMAASLTDPIENTWHVPAYKMSKAALNMFTRSMGRQLAPQHITVSSLDPGWVRTDMGGEEADDDPQEAALDIFNLSIADVPTGKFWYKGKERNW